MFSLYGISGPIFQGTLENLDRIPPVLRRSPATPVARINGQLEANLLLAQENISAQKNNAREQAIDSYRAMLPQELERGPLYHAEQIMQPQVITVDADDDIANAWHTLVKYQIRQAPVLDTGLRLVGIVSERNLLTTFTTGKEPEHGIRLKKVRDIMTTPVIAADPVTDIRRIARVMLDRNVDGVPITNNTGSLIGFISRSDILRAVITDPPLSLWR